MGVLDRVAQMRGQVGQAQTGVQLLLQSSHDMESCSRSADGVSGLSTPCCGTLLLCSTCVREVVRCVGYVHR